MYIARIKYSRQAVPEEIEFATKKEAEEYRKKKQLNASVRWTEIDRERKYDRHRR